MNTSIYSQLILLNKKHNEHYLKRYVKLASFYKERNWTYKSGLHHEHHIVPDSFGGLDLNENLICITPREHFILHHLLYKSFPKSSMVTAFKSMCSGWGHMDFRVTSKVYQNAMLEFIERQSEISSRTQNKLVAEGKHHWSGGEIQKQTQQRRVAEGKHHWLGPENNLKKVAEGRNPFSGDALSRKRLENGTHPSQIKKVCTHCNKEFSLGNFAKYHGDNCKLNPYFIDDKLKIECPHCNRLFLKNHFNRWHGDKCKLKPKS